MLREANAEADRLRSKLKESEKKNRKLEAQVANGVTILAGALPLIERLTKQMLPLDLAELPQEQVRILKENLLQIGVDAEKMDKTVGLVSYFLNKQTESARRVRIGKLERQVEKDKKSLRKTVEDTIRSVKTNEAMLSDAFNVTNAAAGQEADNGTEDHAVAACAFIASKAVSMGEAERILPNSPLWCRARRHWADRSFWPSRMPRSSTTIRAATTCARAAARATGSLRSCWTLSCARSPGAPPSCTTR